MPVDVDHDRLGPQQHQLLRWIAVQVGLLEFKDDDGEPTMIDLDSGELDKIIAQAKNRTVQWSSNKYFGPHHVAWQGVTKAERASLSRSLKKLEERGFIKRLGDGRIKLTTAGYRYFIEVYHRDRKPKPDYSI